MTTHPHIRAILGDDPTGYEAMLIPELLAIDHDAVMAVNRDVADGALEAQALAERVAPLRDALVAVFGEVAARRLDRLPVVARAAFLVDATHRALGDGPDEAALTAELVRQRDMLRRAARLLVDQGSIDGRSLATQSQRFSRKNLCTDVLLLIAVLDEQVEGAGGLVLSRGEIDSAERAVDALLKALAARENGAPSELSDLRARAFTLLVTTYEEVRRMVAYLRWNDGDADAIAPSLWASLGTKGARRKRTSR